MYQTSSILSRKSGTVRTAVFQLLRSLDITTIFGNPGSTELPMYREFPDDFRYVLGLQEATVIGMADGYAQATRNAAFVNLHSAAGVGHAMGNLFTAYKNNAPLIVTAGQQARSMLPYDPFLHSVHATELPQPYVKWRCEPARAQDVPLALAQAYHVAMQAPRGPTFVSIPVDDWEQACTPVAEREVYPDSGAPAAALHEVAQALADSSDPAIVVGAAVDRAGAWDAVVALAEQQRARVWVAPLSGRCSFPERHPLFAGFLPARREAIVRLLTGHDLILVLGAPVFTYHVEGFGPHIPPQARLFQLVDDPLQAAQAAVGHAVTTDLRDGIELLRREAAPTVNRPTPAPRTAPPAIEPAPAISRVLLLHTLAQMRPSDSIIVEESPGSRATMHDHLPIEHPDSFYACSSGGLGYALPAAVGVALAQQRKVIALLGDGSAMYAIQGLWSAVQNHASVTFIVVNNQRYESLQTFAPEFGLHKTVGTTLTGLEFTALAVGHGCPARAVQAPEDLAEALGWALNHDGPALLDVHVHQPEA